MDEDDFGIGPATTVSTPLGKTRSFFRLSLKEILFLSVSALNIIVAVILSIIRLVNVANKEPESSDFTFCILILLNAAFCAFYVAHGVFREREYELYVLVAAILIIVIYCVVEYSVNVDRQTGIKLARLVAACVLGPINMILAVLVAIEFGYLEFRIAGATQMIQVMYRQAALFSSLLKFDLQMASSFVVLALTGGSKLDVLEKVTLGVGLPFVIIWTIIGWLMMRKEIKALSYIFAFLWLAVPAYLLYKVITMYQMLSDGSLEVTDPVVLVTLFAAAALVLVHCMVFIEWIYVHTNFGKGLKERAFDPEGDLTNLVHTDDIM